jgi:hypothetical protein
LNGSAKSLPHVMRGQLDLVVMRHSVALLDRLQLSGQFRRLLQMKFEFFLYLCVFRVHAISPQKPRIAIPTSTKLLSLPQHSANLLLIFFTNSGSLQKLTCTLLPGMLEFALELNRVDRFSIPEKMLAPGPWGFRIRMVARQLRNCCMLRIQRPRAATLSV